MIVKPFKDFFNDYILNEYAHHNADGTPKQTLKAHNGKGGGVGVGLDAKIQHIVGPYQKQNQKLDIGGSILTYPELEEAGIKDAMNMKLPTVFRNVKNSGADIQIYKNQKGMIVGRVIKASLGTAK